MNTVDFPNIIRVGSTISASNGSIEWLRDRFRNDLAILDESIKTIGTEHNQSISGILRDLFSQHEGKICASISELISFGWVATHALKSQLVYGYPNDFPSEDAPFDGAMISANQTLAFDVKDGSGSGFKLLEAHLTKALQRECDSHGVACPSLTIAVDAPLVQKFVGKHIREIIGFFEADIATHGVHPRVSCYDLSEGKIKVGLDSRVGASMMGMDAQSELLFEQIRAHAAHKSRHVSAHDVVGFCLIYSRRAGAAPSDFSAHTFRSACNFLSGAQDLPAALKSVLFLDFEGAQSLSDASAYIWNYDASCMHFFQGIQLQTVCARATPTPSMKLKLARALQSSSIEATACSVVGSCMLQGAKCSARGTMSGVFVYFAENLQYEACSSCVREFGWPAPASNVSLDDV